MSDLRTRLGRVTGAQGGLAIVGSGGHAIAERVLAVAEKGTATPVYSVIEERLAIDDLGLAIVGRGAIDARLLPHLGLRGPAPARWDEVLFLDTETTGLAGGTGTYVFLLGTARIADGELILRQHLLEDLGAEREFIGVLHAELDRFRACASYNGKCFDLPLLRTRVILALRAELAVDDSHLDLLHPARRMWRSRIDSVTLRNVEYSILDCEAEGEAAGRSRSAERTGTTYDARVDDIPGSLIPERFFRYLATRERAIIEPVLRHNARDVIALVRVADRIARDVSLARDRRPPDDPGTAFALARVFDRGGEHDAAHACYESAYADAGTDLRVRVALPYARALERRGDVARAVRMLDTLLGLGLGAPRWRAQVESRIRRLTRRLRGELVLAG